MSAPGPTGLLIVNKQRGLTSRAVVNRVNAILGKSAAAGHAGTLDPLATGVLVVCVGTATRLVEYVQRQVKVYEATIQLGADSDTDDADGTVTSRLLTEFPSEALVAEALARQVGTIWQTPPCYSAVRVEGARAHRLARAGAGVELNAREVRIDEIRVRRYEPPFLDVEVQCGSGTYIRSIARDLGANLGCGGLLTALKRTRIGAFSLIEAIEIDRNAMDRSTLLARLRPPIEALAVMPRLVLDPHREALIRNGRRFFADADMINSDAHEWALVDEAGRLVAIGEKPPGADTIRPVKVFPPSGADESI